MLELPVCFPVYLRVVQQKVNQLRKYVSNQRMACSKLPCLQYVSIKMEYIVLVVTNPAAFRLCTNFSAALLSPFLANAAIIELNNFTRSSESEENERSTTTFGS